MSPPTPLHLPVELHDKLIRLRFFRRWLAIAQAVLALGSALCLLWLTQGVADDWIALPWLVRAVLLAGDAAALVWIYRRYFPAVFRRDPSLAGVALVAEKRWPELHQCLVSAVELAEGMPGTTRGSYALSLEVIAEARWRTQELNFSQLVPWGRFRLWLMVGWVVASVSLMTLVYAWPLSGILLERILLSFTPQTVVIPITKDIAAPIGSDVLLSARTIGRIPTEGRVTITYAGQSAQEFPVAPDAGHPDTFSLTVHNVQKPFTYRIQLNDGQTPLFSVDAEVPPALAAVTFKVIYPRYTSLPPEDRSPGILAILAGSRLHIEATATQSLGSATIRLIGPASPQTIAMTCDPTGKNLTGEIPIPVKDLTGFSIHLVNANGFPSADETVYPVYPIPDRPPVVHLLEPKQDRATIITQAKPVFVIDAADDYGVAKLSLKYQVIAPAAKAHMASVLPERELPLAFDPAKTVHVEYTLDVSAQIPEWQEGSMVEYWIEATDNNDVTGPGVTHTKHQHFEIVSLAEKEREIAGRLKQAANSLDSVAREQDKVTGQVGDGIQH